MRHPACLLVTLILPACSAAPPHAGAGSSAPMIGPDGAMRLRGETVYTLPAIEAAFPGLQVIPLSGEDGPVFQVLSATAQPLFTLEPDWSRGYVGSVVTVSPDVTGPGGAVIGRTRLHHLPYADRASCASLASVEGRTACPMDGANGQFVLVFEADPAGGKPVLSRMAFNPDVPAATAP